MSIRASVVAIVTAVFWPAHTVAQAPPATVTSCAVLCVTCSAYQFMVGDVRVPGQLFWALDSLLLSEAASARDSQVRRNSRTADRSELGDLPASAERALRRLLRDPDDRNQGAVALARIMRGPRAGFSPDQARLAALAYWRLGLSPAAAIGVLTRPGTDAVIMERAILALDQSWGDSIALAAARVAFCELANRIPAYASPGADPFDVLDEATLEAIGYLLGRLDAVVAARPDLAVRLRVAADPQNPVMRWVATTYRSLW